MITDYEIIRNTAKDILTAAFTPVEWEPGTEYAEDDLIRPVEANGFYYRAVSAGVSGETEPEWPDEYGEEIIDGSVEWILEEPVNIRDFFPDDFSYPCVVVGDMRPVNEFQMGAGNIPAVELRLDVDVISYQAKVQKKNLTQTRGQGYGLMKQVQSAIRKNPNFGNIEGILRATSGTYELDEDMPPVMWRMRLAWLIRIMAKR